MKQATPGGRRPGLSRERALAARPEKLPAVNRQRKDDGKLAIRVLLERPRWQRWLGGGDKFERTFVLDTFGQEVYEMCDGRNSVAEIVRKFAKAHNVSDAESELAVTRFLETMMKKGLVAMAVKREQSK